MTIEESIKGTNVVIKLLYDTDDGQEEFIIELDSQVFYKFCLESMNEGMSVEEYIIKRLEESLENI